MRKDTVAAEYSLFTLCLHHVLKVVGFRRMEEAVQKMYLENTWKI